jgi:hypothetical protein
MQPSGLLVSTDDFQIKIAADSEEAAAAHVAFKQFKGNPELVKYHPGWPYAHPDHSAELVPRFDSLVFTLYRLGQPRQAFFCGLEFVIPGVAIALI